MAVGWPIASAIAGRLVPRLGFKKLLVAGFATSAAAALAIALALRPGVPLVAVQAIMLCYGAGLGIANPPLLIAVQTSVDWNRRGIATASTLFFRTIGGTLAVGILGSVLAVVLTGAGAPSQVVEKLLGPERAGLDPAVVTSVAGALQRAMAVVFWSGAAIAAAAFVVVLAFPHVPVVARPAAAGPAPRPPERGEGAA
jgi:MFS family permease